MLVKRWHERYRRDEYGFPTNVLRWQRTADGRAVLVSKRTPQAYVARFVWQQWNRRVMQGCYYPLVRTLDLMGVLALRDGYEHRLSDWKTFSLREATIRHRITTQVRGARRTMLYDAIYAMEHPQDNDGWTRWTQAWWEEMDAYQTDNPALKRLLDGVRD